MNERIDDAVSVLRKAARRYGINKLSVHTVPFWNGLYRNGGVSFRLHHVLRGFLLRLAAVEIADLVPFTQALLDELTRLRSGADRKAA